MANPRIDKRSNQRLALRKQAGLHLLGDRQVVRSLALPFQPGGLGASLCFQRARRLIELNQSKTVSFHIFKNRVPRWPASPGRFHWWERETDSASRPFFEQAMHVFGKKTKSGALADALVLRGSFGWNYEGIPGRPAPVVPGSQPAAGGATTIHRPSSGVCTSTIASKFSFSTKNRRLRP